MKINIIGKLIYTNEEYCTLVLESEINIKSSVAIRSVQIVKGDKETSIIPILITHVNDAYTISTAFSVSKYIGTSDKLEGEIKLKKVLNLKKV